MLILRLISFIIRRPHSFDFENEVVLFDSFSSSGGLSLFEARKRGSARPHLIFFLGRGYFSLIAVDLVKNRKMTVESGCVGF